MFCVLTSSCIIENQFHSSQHVRWVHPLRHGTGRRRPPTVRSCVHGQPVATLRARSLHRLNPELLLLPGVGLPLHHRDAIGNVAEFASEGAGEEHTEGDVLGDYHLYAGVPGRDLVVRHDN